MSIKQAPFTFGGGTAAADDTTVSRSSVHDGGGEAQHLDAFRPSPVALAAEASAESCVLLNQILADSITLYGLYAKSDWRSRGHDVSTLRLLLKRHADEQMELIALLSARVLALGGVVIADRRHIERVTTIPRAPDGAKEVPALLSRLLDAHEIIIAKIRVSIGRMAQNYDDETHDLLRSDVLSRHGLQVWFVAGQLVDTPTAERSNCGGREYGRLHRWDSSAPLMHLARLAQLLLPPR